MTLANRAKTIGLVLFLTMPLLAWGQQLPAGAMMLTPSELQWKPGAAPVGAQFSELVGSRAQPGFYVERVQFPGVLPIIGSIITLLAAAAIASLLPAARAARVDVVQALRTE